MGAHSSLGSSGSGLQHAFSHSSRDRHLLEKHWASRARARTRLLNRLLVCVVKMSEALID